MTEKRIADLLNINTRYLRSVQLERDFIDADALNNYVLTDFTKSCFSRLAEGFKPDSGRRAWRMTGDYGSGKSSFALLLARSLGDSYGVPHRLRQALPKQINIHSRMTPILCTCSRRPLGLSITEAIHKTASNLYSKGNKPRFISEIESALHSKHEPNEEDVVSFLEKLNTRIISDRKGKGIVLILDELGKFLEFATLNSSRQDVFLLQRIAEIASRSGSQPLFVVCLLHQGFNAYTDQLNQTTQREWEKVAGRYEEIVFNQPIEQITQLISAALNINVDSLPKRQISSFQQAMEQSLDLKWFNNSEPRVMINLAPKLYPLHPTVLPVLIRIFKRFGQNERSLFSFLLSNEPFGLQAFSEQRLSEAQPYRLHNLFDYVRINIGHRLSVQSYRSHWNLIESVIESYATEEPLQIQILKTIGLLNLLNDDLLATDESIICAINADDTINQQQIKNALDKLRNTKRVIYDRGRTRGYCLWPHTSVDLEKVYDESRRNIQTPQNIAPLIKEYLKTMPIVTRRHYIETGNLRYFNVRYCSINEMPEAVLNNDGEEETADGYIVIPLCETTAEREIAIKFARNEENKEKNNLIIAIPQSLNNLTSLVQEVQRWNWVLENTIELNGDKFAREEVSRQYQAARLQLEAGIQNRIGLKHFYGDSTLEWFYQGKIIKIRNGRHLLTKLSDICDEIYTHAPHIHNELVNRRNLSSAAAAARMRLIERMLKDKDKEWLGMDSEKKPPEMSMYLSVLFNTGIHQKYGDKWLIGGPNSKHADRCQVIPSLKRINEIIQKKPDTRINIAGIFDKLKKPPFGVRDGLIPILLTVFAISHEKDMVFYKDGTFIRELTSEIMLELIKMPERFEMQNCKIEGVRAEIFDKLLNVLEIKKSKERETELLDVVKPLCVFIAQLPTYVHSTKKVSVYGSSVRDTIINAREPGRLLFEDLPKACGMKPFLSNSNSNAVQLFIKTLKSALEELRLAYPELQERIKKILRREFELPGSFREFRISLASRAEKVVLGINEPKLKAFCLRLMDDNLPESEWIESVGSFIALKPPSKWHDAEEENYEQEINQLSKRFRHVESIVFSNGKPLKNSIGIRLSITQANGAEHEQVIHYSANEENALRELQEQFETLIAKDQRLGLAAISRAIWSRIRKDLK